MREDPEGEEGNGCLKYIVEVKTKSPIDERTKIVVVRNINLNIWKALDEHLPKDICCSVYSQDPEHDNQMREEGAKAEREKWQAEREKLISVIDEKIANARVAAANAVLDELAQMYANVPEQILEGTYRLHSEWKEKIESLRHGQTHEQQGTTAGGR